MLTTLLSLAERTGSEKRNLIKMSDNRTVPKTDEEWAHWEATSEEDALSERCPFCPCLKGNSGSPSLRDRNRIFHYRRSGFQKEVGVGSLCLFCQHLDPSQLFGHSDEESDDVIARMSIFIELGTFAELEARRQCAFCHVVVCTVRAHTAVYQTEEEPISGDRLITISRHYHQFTTIDVEFGQDTPSSMTVKNVLPMHLQSVPELIRIARANIARRKISPRSCHPFPRALRIGRFWIPRKDGLLVYLDCCPEVNKIVGSSISWKQIRRWIDSCSTKHAECHPTATTPSGMRLIDVRNRKITPELDSRHRHAFVALSYVWGKNVDPRKCVLLKKNTTQLEKTKSLKDLPKTIEDAIRICENLGQRFLWVDRLCIVQDDEAKKGHQIHAMADIFQSALLTLVSTSGDSMESPIPGVGTERRAFQSQTRIAGLEVTSGLPRLSQSFTRSCWSQRGWTYQENVLSSRKLYFTDLEVWFTCTIGFQREDVSVDDRDMGHIVDDDIPMTQLHSLSPRRPIGVMEDYWRHLREYTKRSLTHQSDIYNAFTGILTALFGEDKTVYGLPKLYLDNALLWRLAADTSPWDIRDPTLVEQHLLYPSWAWSSINGAVENDGSRECGKFHGSIVLWSFVGEDGKAKTIDVVECWGGKGSFDYVRLSLAFAWLGGCFEAPFPSDLRKKLELHSNNLWEWANDDLVRRWPTRKEFWNEVHSRGGPDTQVLLTTSNYLRPGMLLTRTQTAVLRLGTCRKKSSIFEYFEILNEHGESVGGVEANELCLKSNTKGNQRLETVVYEIMALSLSDPPPIDIILARNLEIGTWLDGLKVFLISWDKNALVARRVSIGWVYLNAWMGIERTWKTVVLQ